MRWMRQVVLMGLLAVAARPTVAEAGRRPFIWVFDTEIVPKGEMELEQWLWSRSKSPDRPDASTKSWVWWGPVFGLTQQLELAVPFQVVASRERTELDSVDVDARLRLRPRGDDSPYQQLVRLVYHQTIRGGAAPRVDANLVQSYQWEGGTRLVLDLGAQVSLPFLRAREAEPSVLGSYALGVSHPVLEDELRVSLEAFGEIPVANLPQGPHHFIGADVAWTSGRFWVTAGVLVGLTPVFPETPYFMPRLIWAVLL